MLWSSLGVGLLVFSAGSLLTATRFIDAVPAIIVGSIAGSLLLALAGKIGSDHAVPSLISTRPSFGIHGASIPAILNVMQLIGWTVFEIMIMSKATEILTGNRIPYYLWTILFGAFVILLGIVGPLTVVRQVVGKICDLGGICRIDSNNYQSFDVRTSFETAISIWRSWNVLLLCPRYCNSFTCIMDAACADYNRFAKDSKGAFRGTFVGFAITNILFYFGGVLVGNSDVVAIILAIQSIFFRVSFVYVYFTRDY